MSNSSVRFRANRFVYARYLEEGEGASPKTEALILSVRTRPLMTRLKPGAERSPPGKWKIEKPSQYKGNMKAPAAKLTPLGNQVVDYPMREYVNRPFLIHGPGEKGSDGCIVIEKIERKRLLDAIEKAGGATLLVTQAAQESDLLSRNLKLRTTA